jgi:hypothetical protein
MDIVFTHVEDLRGSLNFNSTHVHWDLGPPTIIHVAHYDMYSYLNLSSPWKYTVQ